MSRDLVIVVPLRGEDWRPPLNGSKGGWSCSALRMPSARFVRLRRTDGRSIAEEAYAVRGSNITWKGGTEPAPGIQVELLLKRRLFSGFAVAAALVLGGLLGGVVHENRGELEARLDRVVQSMPMSLNDARASLK